MNFLEAKDFLFKESKIARKEWTGGQFLIFKDNKICSFVNDIGYFPYDLSIFSKTKEWHVMGETKLIDFFEAIEELKNDKKLQLKTWDPSFFIQLSLGRQHIIFVSFVENSFIPTAEDLFANDWEVVL